MFLTLGAFTARAVWLAWQDRSGQARADAVFALVDERTPLRPTDTPGATAWLQLELDHYGSEIAAPERAGTFRAFATSGAAVPDALAPILTALRDGLPATPSSDMSVVRATTNGTQARREEALIAYQGRQFVTTRRRGAAGSGGDAEAFVRATLPILHRATNSVTAALRESPLPATPDQAPPHPVRVYAVSEDGTLASAPWADGVTTDEQELALLGSRPLLPVFAPQEFFFRFPPDAPASDVWYSGFYLDLGGRGLVSTVMLPYSVDGRSAVLALDLAFSIDWSAFGRSVDAPVVGAAAHNVAADRASWAAFQAALGADAPASLREAVESLARRSGEAADGALTPVRQGVADGIGAVVAFQVSDSTWMLMLFPQAAPSFPVVPLVLMGGVLALLLTGLELNRRRAERERRNAERAFAEKQNLLDTMQVPLVVVDPNTDIIVSSNRSAEVIGLRAGSRFADFVAADPRARAHYERMQVATPEPRRAYGVPVRVPGEGADVVRHAVVRSVAVTAPITALEADERHRLGIVFLLEQDTDLPLLADDLASAAHRQERQRLAGLLSHGVDTLARVLEHQLKQPSDESTRGFSIWLSGYLERRLTVTGWLLDHWDWATIDGVEVVIDATQARATVARLIEVFTLASSNRDLRARLHWSNGVLSAPTDSPLDVHIDWPDAVVIGCPVRGGFGVFVGELLTNAIRHGTPGRAPRLEITFERVRRQLQFTITNDTAPGTTLPDIEAYGGLDIVLVMARLFKWPLTLECRGGQFVAAWSAPVSDKGDGQAD